MKNKLALLKESLILKNSFLLFFLQITNYIFPFALVPYIIKIFGIDKYGIYILAQSILQYFILVSDYGFNYVTPRYISSNRNSNKRVSLFINLTLQSKLLISIIIFPLVLVVPYIFKNIDIYFLIFLYGTVLSYALYPVWLFQGMEEMSFITISNFLIKLISLLLIFQFLKGVNDFILLPIIMTLSQLFITIITLYFSVKRYKVKLYIVKSHLLFKYIKGSTSIFLSRFSTSLYANSNIILLGLFSNEYIISIYSIAEKLVKSTTMLISSVTQAVYPRIVSYYHFNKNSGERLLSKVLMSLTIVSIILSITIIFSSDLLGKIFLGKDIYLFKLNIYILGVIPIAVAISNVLGICFYVAMKLDGLFLKITSVVGIINPIIFFIFWQVSKELTAALTLVSTEIISALIMYYYYKQISKSIHVKNLSNSVLL